MELEVGKYYYYLTADQHDLIHDLYPGCPFVEGPDGYYVSMDAFTEGDLYDYLLDEDMLNLIYYSKSNKPGGGM